MYLLKIKELRNKRKISQIKLAKKTGISQTWISDAENNRNSPDLKRLNEIANMLGVKIKDLFDEK